MRNAGKYEELFAYFRECDEEQKNAILDFAFNVRTFNDSVYLEAFEKLCDAIALGRLRNERNISD